MSSRDTFGIYLEQLCKGFALLDYLPTVKFLFGFLIKIEKKKCACVVLLLFWDAASRILYGLQNGEVFLETWEKWPYRTFSCWVILVATVGFEIFVNFFEYNGCMVIFVAKE